MFENLKKNGNSHHQFLSTLKVNSLACNRNRKAALWSEETRA